MLEREKDGVIIDLEYLRYSMGKNSGLGQAGLNESKLVGFKFRVVNLTQNTDLEQTVDKAPVSIVGLTLRYL